MNLSYSKINTYLSCPKKYDLKYNKNIYPKQRKDYFTFGTSFHLLIENIITEEMTTENIINQYIEALKAKEINKNLDFEAEKIKFEVLANGFLNEYKNFFKNFEIIEIEKESVIKFEIDNEEILELKLIPDMILQNKITEKVYILDHKTTSMNIDNFNSISTKMQPYLYAYYIKREYSNIKEITFIYNVIKKFNSLIKLSKADKGDYNNLKKRLEDKLQKEKYFKMFDFVIKLDDELDERIEKHIINFYNAEKINKYLNYYPCNELGCDLFGGCEYKELCKNNFKLSEKLKEKFEIK